MRSDRSGICLEAKSVLRDVHISFDILLLTFYYPHYQSVSKWQGTPFAPYMQSSRWWASLGNVLDGTWALADCCKGPDGWRGRVDPERGGRGMPAAKGKEKNTEHGRDARPDIHLYLYSRWGGGFWELSSFFLWRRTSHHTQRFLSPTTSPS